MTSRAVDTGMLMNKAQTSKNAKVYLELPFCSLRDLTNALLSLTDEKLLPQCVRILVRKPTIVESTTQPPTVTKEKCKPWKYSTSFLEHKDLNVSLTKW